MKEQGNTYTPLTLLEMSEATEKRVAGISKEFANGFNFLKNYPKSVTFFGSARTKEGEEDYEKARHLAGRIVEELRYSIITGGGPGIMEAANRGAYEAGGNSLGLNIELPHEQINNKYLTDSIEFHYFFSRKVCMSFCAEAYIFFPGGFGTLDECLEILTLVQTKKIHPMPIIFYGKKFWSDFDKVFRDQLLKGDKIEEQDLNLYKITEDDDEIIEIIRKAPIQIGNRYEEPKNQRDESVKTRIDAGPINGLSKKHCFPCEDGAEPLTHEESENFLKEVSQWTLLEDKEIEKTYNFGDFAEAINFMNKIGELAEAEGHHPDIKLHDFKKVTVRISTHSIKGLSENDFILASKIDELVR